MTNVAIFGANMVETTREEFVAFLLDRKVGITVENIQAELTRLNIPFRKKALKAELANLLFDALAAAGETLVAEQSTINNYNNEKNEEEVEMKEIKLVEVVKAGGYIKQEDITMDAFNKSLPTPSVKARKELGIYHEAASHVDDSAFREMMDKVNAQKDAYMRNVAPYEVVVDDINFYAPSWREATSIQRRNNDIIREIKIDNGSIMRVVGDVTVKIPKGYMLIKQWDANKPNSKGTLGAPVMVPFEGVNLNLAKKPFNMFRPLPKGDGYLVLSIVEFVDKDGNVSPLSVSLPTEKDKKTGIRYPIFHTADSRFIKTKNAERVDEPLYLSDNNANFNAQVTAYVQMWANEFVAANPENNHAFKKECGNLIRFMTKDGVADDLYAESKKTRYIQEQVDTTQLSRVGAEQPSMYCPIHNFWVDMEYVMTVNESEQFDRNTQLLDDKGKLRHGSFDEIPVAGHWVKKSVLKESIINKVCGNCRNFCGSYQKTQAQIAKERMERIEEGEVNPYVSPFFRETAKPKAQAIQTLTLVEGVEKWVNKFPYEVLEEGKEVLDMRVMGAGLVVYGSDNIEFEADYVVPVEEFDARHADVMKKINHIFYAAFNYSKLTAEQVRYVNELVFNKPEDLTKDEEKRWDNAVNWYKQGIQWDLERQEASRIVPFATAFHIGAKEGMEEIHVEDIMGETMARAEEGTLMYGLGYQDLTPEEFTRYLDDVAMDYIYDVIIEGKEFAIVGGSRKDKELAAGALQSMLQRELTGNFVAFANGDYRDNSYAAGIRRSDDPKATLDGFKVAPKVKAYLAQICGLSK